MPLLPFQGITFKCSFFKGKCTTLVGVKSICVSTLSSKIVYLKGFFLERENSHTNVNINNVNINNVNTNSFVL